MPETISIAVADLLLDPGNARLPATQASQPHTVLAMAQQQGTKLLNLAESILRRGLDPSSLPIVVPSQEEESRYVVLEGNRRISAIKAMETPSLVLSAFQPRDRKRLLQLAEDYAQDPRHFITCVVYRDESDDEYAHWIRLRHTGQNEGEGLVEWGSNEKDRFSARHGRRSIEGQVLDFVIEYGALSAAARSGTMQINTSLKRLIQTPEVRQRMGLERKDGEILLWYQPHAVLPVLTHVIERLMTRDLKVTDIYTADDRKVYIENLPASLLPTDEARLSEPIPLSAVTAASMLRSPAEPSDADTSPTGSSPGESSGGRPFPAAPPPADLPPGKPTAVHPAPTGDGLGGAASTDLAPEGPVPTDLTSAGPTPPGPLPADPAVVDAPGDVGPVDEPTSNDQSNRAPRQPRPSNDRSFLIPKTCRLSVPRSRIRDIQLELMTLGLDSFTNAASVLLRVFLELSVDRYIKSAGILSGPKKPGDRPLAMRLKAVAKHLEAAGEIDTQQSRAIAKAADGKFLEAGSTTTMNQYVHNEHVFPKPSELATAWNELEPFMVALWKNCPT